MSAADHRTVKELLAESDALARETLFDATLEARASHGEELESSGRAGGFWL